MQTGNLKKAAILTTLLVILAVACWELYLRSRDFKPSYDDGEELWSHKRAMVYEPNENATVFIGSSRIKYDLDIETWENITGDHAIQLAIEGECPRLVLEDLGSDPGFKGRLVVDVTEGLFFSSSPFTNTKPKKHIAYFKERTPAQRASLHVNRLLESGLVCLDRDNFSFNAMLGRLPIPKRKGVFSLPFDFPAEFGRVSFGRQNMMMDRFLVDTNLKNQVTGLWMFFDKINDEAPVSGDSLDHVLQRVKNAVDNIRQRGGQVIFVRTPSSGYYWPAEQKSFPRDKYWDRLLSFTNSPGIHFTDHKEIAHFILPEWSHMSRPQAIEFTKSFIGLLEQKGWVFPHNQNNTNSKNL
jgi:hypothetical protein